MLSAALLFAHAIVLDPPSGVWFPPAGTRAEYLERRRSYASDLKEAFADPGVVKSVCSVVSGAPQPGAEVDPRLRQMRLTLNMACVSAMASLRERPAAEARETSVSSSLDQQLEQALAFAAMIPAARQREAERKLLEEIDAMTEAGPQRLTAILRAIALRPQDARGAWLLLRASIDARLSPRELAVYVERLYRTRAAALGPDAPRWEQGLAEVLLYLGKDEGALRVAETKGDRNSDYDRMLLAFVQQLRGDANAIDAAFAHCSDAQLCRNVIWSLATRTARVRGQLTPPAVAPIVERTIPWYGNDWPVRLETTRVLAALDPARGRKALTAIYATRNLPGGALLDTMQIDASVSRAENDHLRSIALADCWLVLRRVAIAPLPPDAWTRFAALDEPRAPGSTDGCAYQARPDDPILTDCTSRLLGQRLRDAMYVRDWPLAQQSIERLVAYTLAAKIAPTTTRSALVELAGTMLREGDPRDAARIVRYLDRQPLSAATRFKLDSFRQRLPQSQEVTLEPWSRAPKDPAERLPRMCR